MTNSENENYFINNNSIDALKKTLAKYFISNLNNKNEEKKIEEDKFDGGIYILLSVKILTYNNNYYMSNEDWVDVNSIFIKEITINMRGVGSDTYFELLRIEGNKVYFYLRLTNRKDLFTLCPTVYEAIKKTEKFVNENKLKLKNQIFLGATLWRAGVEHSFSKEKKGILKDIYRNKMIPVENSKDFIGADIYRGIKLSKYAMKNTMIVGAELAYILSCYRDEIKNNFIERFKDSEQIQENSENKIDVFNYLRIIKYITIPNIWEDRSYPLVVYSTTEIKVQKKNDFLKNKLSYSQLSDYRIMDSYHLESIKGISDIMSDVGRKTNLDYEIENLIDNPSNIKEYHFDRISTETHVAVICMHLTEEKILIFERKRTGNHNDSRWEFGCAKVTYSETFKQVAERIYKKDFNIDLNLITVNNRIKPISVYNFQKKVDIVNGIICVGIVNNPDDVDLTGSEFNGRKKWIKYSEYESFSQNNNCVSDFKETIKLAINLREDHVLKENQ